LAAGHYPFLPINLLLRDKWDNMAALQHYQGPLEIIAAQSDTIIPVSQAKLLSDSKPSSLLHIVAGDHIDWAAGGKVRTHYVQAQ
jgi:fermentation-respiration switch protein FrsA (DUF1100 family)